jgi:hypothetical protein
MQSNEVRAAVRPITGKAESFDKAAKYAAMWANTFETVLSAQVTCDPLEASGLKYKYVVFGKWKDAGPRERFANGAPFDQAKSYAIVAERPLEDGTIMYFRKTEDEVEQLIAFLKSEGVKDAKLLDKARWLADGLCVNRPQSSGGGCESISCTGICSYCEPGHYCCC